MKLIIKLMILIVIIICYLFMFMSKNQNCNNISIYDEIYKYVGIVYLLTLNIIPTLNMLYNL